MITASLSRSPRSRGRIALRVAAVAAVAGLALAGCSTPPNQAANTEGSTSDAAPVSEAIEGRPVPTDQSHDGEIKIAMIGFANNPYWVAVEDGVKAANDLLTPLGGSAEWIVAGATIDVQTVNNAINAASAQGYTGIGFFIAGEGNCQVVQQLTGEGLYLGAYNTLFDCLQDAGAVINYAQEQYDAGKMAAEELIKATDGATGTVGIITSSFTAPGAEQRRTGFIDGLKGSNITPISEGVEAKDSASETYSAAQNYLQSSDDLLGIYATAGGPFGAAEAVAAADKQDTVKVIGFDLSDENLAAIKNGSMYAAIGQDAFGQGYNVAIELYNAAVTGEKPAEVLVPAESAFVTAENLDEHDPATQPTGKLGTS